MSKIKKWCKQHNYNEDIEELIRELQEKYNYTEDDLLDTLQTLEKVTKECNVSIQELIGHLMFLLDRY